MLLNGANERLSSLKSELWKEYNMILSHEECYWFQQAKSKWVTLGDSNTRFFHQSTITRRRKNRIMALLDRDDQWIYDDSALQNHVIQFFSDLYTSNPQDEVNYSNITSFPPIKEEDKAFIEKAVTKDEVKKALFSMGSYKSPGPDGYHPIFFKKHWNHIGNSIYKLVVNCFANPSLIKDLNQTLISLIPKCDDPSKVTHLRPIALCNVSYKIISKVIVQRLKCFLPYVVSPNQSSFIAGRSAIDNILVMQEAIHSLNHLKGNKGYMIIKLDLEKAYDRLE